MGWAGLGCCFSAWGVGFAVAAEAAVVVVVAATVEVVAVVPVLSAGASFCAGVRLVLAAVSVGVARAFEADGDGVAGFAGAVFAPEAAGVAVKADDLGVADGVATLGKGAGVVGLGRGIADGVDVDSGRGAKFGVVGVEVVGGDEEGRGGVSMAKVAAFVTDMGVVAEPV